MIGFIRKLCKLDQDRNKIYEFLFNTSFSQQNTLAAVYFVIMLLYNLLFSFITSFISCIYLFSVAHICMHYIRYAIFTYRVNITLMRNGELPCR